MGASCFIRLALGTSSIVFYNTEREMENFKLGPEIREMTESNQFHSLNSTI